MNRILGTRALVRVLLSFTLATLILAGCGRGEKSHKSTQPTEVLQPAAQTRSMPFPVLQRTNQQKPGKYSEAVKNQTLRKLGYDPDEWILDDDLNILPKPQKPVVLPANIKYYIKVTRPGGSSETYYSETEPKPFGNGYKFKVAGIEMVVSGDVRIIRIRR